MMRIAFIGLGSIAKRHIMNLSTVLEERGVDYQIDVYRHGNALEQSEKIAHLVSAFYSLGEWGNRQYDVTFITNPTALHYETVKQSVGFTKHMFIEKPVFGRAEADIEALSLRTDAVYYVACPLRYTEVLQYIREHINLQEVYAVRAISSSYLPEWRLGKDYRDTYSAKQSLGGGVATDLIHEWDYLVFLFGFPDNVLYAGGKYSALEIETDDLAVYIGIYPDKMVELHLDYFGQATHRELQLFLKEDTVIVDFVRCSITWEKIGKEISFDENRDAYQRRELEHFLDILDGKCGNDSDIQHAVKVLGLSEGTILEENA